MQDIIENVIGVAKSKVALFKQVFLLKFGAAITQVRGFLKLQYSCYNEEHSSILELGGHKLITVEMTVFFPRALSITKGILKLEMFPWGLT